MNIRPVGGHSSETLCHHIDMIDDDNYDYDCHHHHHHHQWSSLFRKLCLFKIGISHFESDTVF
jgi:hypothetical protein